MNAFIKEAFVQQSNNENILQDGSVQISLSWMEPKVDQEMLKKIKEKSMDISVTSEDK